MVKVSPSLEERITPISRSRARAHVIVTEAQTHNNKLINDLGSIKELLSRDKSKKHKVFLAKYQSSTVPSREVSHDTYEEFRSASVKLRRSLLPFLQPYEAAWEVVNRGFAKLNAGVVGGMGIALAAPDGSLEEYVAAATTLAFLTNLPLVVYGMSIVTEESKQTVKGPLLASVLRRFEGKKLPERMESFSTAANRMQHLMVGYSENVDNLVYRDFDIVNADYIPENELGDLKKLSAISKRIIEGGVAYEDPRFSTARTHLGAAYEMVSLAEDRSPNLLNS